MSADNTFEHYRKLYAPRAGQEASELTQVKAHWLSLPEPQRDEWCSFLFSSATVPEIRKWIFEKSGISLDKRDQIKRFRKWLVQQELATKKATDLKEREERIIEENKDWPLDRVREKVLQEAYFSTLTNKDFKTGLQTVNAHCRVESNELSQRRYDDSKRAAEAKAMQFCLDETRDYPEVQELFKQAFAALEKATAPK